MFHCHLDYFQKPPPGCRPKHKTGRPWCSERWQPLIYSIYHAWGPAWIEIYWNSIWLRAQSHMTSHYTWGYVTTLHDFGGILGRALDTFCWALTISWSRLLAHVWPYPWGHFKHETERPWSLQFIAWEQVQTYFECIVSCGIHHFVYEHWTLNSKS